MVLLYSLNHPCSLGFGGGGGGIPYSDERKHRKDFILERKLLYSNPFEKGLSVEERELSRRYDVFMRFHSKEEHEDLLQTVIEEHRTLQRIQDLKVNLCLALVSYIGYIKLLKCIIPRWFSIRKPNFKLIIHEAQAAGCRTSVEADRYLELKRRREAEEASRRAKEGAQAGPSSQGGANVFMASESVGKDSNSRPSGQASSIHVNNSNIMGFNETQLLSEAEKRLCCEIRLAPPLYLRMQEVICREIFSGNVNKKADAHHLIKIEPSKVDGVYDMLVKKGLAPP